MLINSLSLKNFKCFEELDVKFAPITLLTGANSSGKSSLINAILALLQTEQFPLYLSPNGKYVNMGSFEEMVFNKEISNNISMEIKPSWFAYTYFLPEFKWVWSIDKNNGLPALEQLFLKFEGKYLVNEEWEFSINKDGKYYIMNLYVHAPDDRFGERIPYLFEQVDFIKDCIVLQKVNNSIVGLTIRKVFESIHQLFDVYTDLNFIFRDVFLENFLIKEKNFNYLGSFRLPPERTYNQKAKAQSKISTDGNGYIDQIVEWLENNDPQFNSLIDSLQKLELLNAIQIDKFKGNRFDLNVKVKENANFASLTDVGFGISQFLPIIVADLQLPKNSCLAISQPEIHLHPSVQATFGNYLANQIKNTQKQYIVETHSEYLLNRIRLLLVTGELKPEDVRVLYFENDGVKSTVHDVEFATDGQVKGAPQGFFDTYGIDVMNIAMNAIG